MDMGSCGDKADNLRSKEQFHVKDLAPLLDYPKFP